MNLLWLSEIDCENEKVDDLFDENSKKIVETLSARINITLLLLTKGEIHPLEKEKIESIFTHVFFADVGAGDASRYSSKVKEKIAFSINLLKSQKDFSASIINHDFPLSIVVILPGKKILLLSSIYAGNRKNKELKLLLDDKNCPDDVVYSFITRIKGELELESYKRWIDAYNLPQKDTIDNIVKITKTQSIQHLNLLPKSVLIVTDVRFWEHGLGSHSRILSLCNELDKKFNLTIFFYGTLSKNAFEKIKETGIAANFVSYKQYQKKAEGLINQVKFPNPSGLQHKRHDIFVKTLEFFLQDNARFDAIIYQYIWLGYTKIAPSYKTVNIIDTHDLMSYRDYRFTAQGASASISISLKEEIEILDNFDVVVAIQNEEAKALENLLHNAKPICCPHAVERLNSNYTPLTLNGFQVGFVGGSSDANKEAITWYLEEVHPLTLKAGALINIYGGVCDRLQQYTQQEGIVLHGKIDDLMQAYSNNHIMINPMIHGGGLKIKSVEALAHGKPLIASPEGAIGINNPAQSGVIVANNRAEFIDAILNLMNKPHDIELMSYLAMEAARKQFSPEICFHSLVELIEAV